MEDKTEKRNWFGRHKALTISFCFVLLMFIGQVIREVKGPTRVSESSNAVPSLTPTPTSDDPCASVPIDNPGKVDKIECMRLHAQAEDFNRQQEMAKDPLGATVKYDNFDVYFTNTETASWSCAATVDESSDPNADNYISSDFNVAAGQTTGVAWRNFATSQGQRFDYFQTKPKSATLYCDANGKRRKATFGLQ